MPKKGERTTRFAVRIYVEPANNNHAARVEKSSESFSGIDDQHHHHEEPLHPPAQIVALGKTSTAETPRALARSASAVASFLRHENASQDPDGNASDPTRKPRNLTQHTATQEGQHHEEPLHPRGQLASQEKMRLNETEDNLAENQGDLVCSFASFASFLTCENMSNGSITQSDATLLEKAPTTQDDQHHKESLHPSRYLVSQEKLRSTDQGDLAYPFASFLMCANLSKDRDCNKSDVTREQSNLLDKDPAVTESNSTQTVNIIARSNKDKSKHSSETSTYRACSTDVDRKSTCLRPQSSVASRLADKIQSKSLSILNKLDFVCHCFGSGIKGQALGQTTIKDQTRHETVMQDKFRNKHLKGGVRDASVDTDSESDDEIAFSPRSPQDKLDAGCDVFAPFFAFAAVFEIQPVGLEIDKVAAIRKQNRFYLVTGIEDQEDVVYRYPSLSLAQDKMKLFGYRRLKPPREVKWKKIINELHGDPKVVQVYYREGGRDFKDATVEDEEIPKVVVATEATPVLIYETTRRERLKRRRLWRRVRQGR